MASVTNLLAQTSQVYMLGKKDRNSKIFAFCAF